MSDKSHILVIDDEKNYLLVLQTLLEDEGYTVTAISDPETALAFLAESEVDVVVTDMKMPKVSGREVLQHVKKSWPYIPVLIMTAFGSIESAVEAMKYGAFDYITKPFSNDELLLSIHNATELARAHQMCIRDSSKNASAAQVCWLLLCWGWLSSFLWTVCRPSCVPGPTIWLSLIHILFSSQRDAVSKPSSIAQ